MAGRDEPVARRQGERGTSEVDLLPGRTDEAAQHGLGGVDEFQGELVADPLGLEGIFEPRAEIPALFPETGDTSSPHAADLGSPGFPIRGGRRCGAHQPSASEHLRPPPHALEHLDFSANH